MSESYAQVTRAYQSSDSDELTLTLGTVVKILRKHDNGWWVGELSGRVGTFPYYCVQEIQQPVRPAAPKPQLQTNPTIPAVPTASITGEYVEAVYDYAQNGPLELSLQRGDKILVLNKTPNGWWQGRSERGQGIFPSNFTKPYTTQATQEETYVFVAAFDYFAKTPQELSFKAGSVTIKRTKTFFSTQKSNYYFCWTGYQNLARRSQRLVVRRTQFSNWSIPF